ncbi:PREDICTED: uncharacterized protein LOC109466573 [Branchiostoma belcheri]|uniref:Uncharacterized protein LOC109466573 n=1 Tax=Branchiostoma belcheri TaxID=7741 RepID=A0A6P4YMD7_BRABE|nr:PREDICTED: uncharacterized protein LOC109466573 [Branchiostoma belcheri]
MAKGGSAHKQRKYDVARLQSQEVVDRFQLDLQNRFSVLADVDDDTEKIWEDLKEGLTSSATKVVGHKRTRKKDLLSEETLQVVEARREARLRGNPHRALVYWKPVDNRLLMARLRHKHGNISIIVAYAPTEVASEEDKDSFYIKLSALTSGISRHDIIWVLGDLNAATGSDRRGFEHCLGPHGVGECNDNGRRLLEYCSSHRLRTERSFFPHKRIHSMTWISNDHYTTKEVDHILTTSRWHSSSDCRVLRSAEFGNTDHRLLALTVALRLEKTTTQHKQRKYDVARLQSQEVVDRFQLDLQNRFSVLADVDDDTEKIWEDLKEGLTSSATKVVGHKRTRKKDLLSEETLQVVEARREARLRGNREEYRRLNSRRNHLLSRDKQRWLNNLATTAETAARTGNQGTLYKTLRTLSGKVTPPTACVKALDGSDLDTPEQQLDRWREHFCNLLNRPPPPPSPQLESLVAEASEDDSISADPPTQEEVLEAIGKLKPGRAAGVDGIPPELLLKGGPATVRHQRLGLRDGPGIDGCNERR